VYIKVFTWWYIRVSLGKEWRIPAKCECLHDRAWPGR
jgi:hypothetical protein